ncbi:hypothetical protein J6590_077164 [Homalodisca vitripennis]|nr:hypothetical protein J6590_077164 [Homalodisca vitripennis]
MRSGATFLTPSNYCILLATHIKVGAVVTDHKLKQRHLNNKHNIQIIFSTMNETLSWSWQQGKLYIGVGNLIDSYQKCTYTGKAYVERAKPRESAKRLARVERLRKHYTVTYYKAGLRHTTCRVTNYAQISSKNLNLSFKFYINSFSSVLRTKKQTENHKENVALIRQAIEKLSAYRAVDFDEAQPNSTDSSHEHGKSRAREVTSTGSHEHGKSRAREVTSTRSHEHEKSRAREVTSTGSHEHEKSRAREVTSTGSHEHGKSRARSHVIQHR